MAAKISTHLNGDEAAEQSGDPASAVHVSRRALHEQRLAEIEADLNSGACSPDEAVERMIQATLTLYRRWLPPRARAEAAELLRELHLTHPGLRGLLEKK